MNGGKAPKRAEPDAEEGSVSAALRLSSTFKPWLEMHAAKRAGGPFQLSRGLNSWGLRGLALTGFIYLKEKSFGLLPGQASGNFH